MDPSVSYSLGVVLLLLNAFFVAAEYGIVASRRTRIESLAQKGDQSAKTLLKVLADTNKAIAAIQVGVTICGLGLGVTIEPALKAPLERLFGANIPDGVSLTIALVFVTYVTVVFGELLPKYVALARGEWLALVLAAPMKAVIALLSPIAIVAQATATNTLKPFKIRTREDSENMISREELSLLLRAGNGEGLLEETHAAVVSKALRFDKLDAADIMVHRLDMKWVDADTPPEELLSKLSAIPHSRIPVCNGDIDDIVGIAYIQDVLRSLAKGPLDLKAILRPVEIVPENLTLNRIVQRMRETRTQILVVADEYGGTSGLITLEDVVEEVFGEMEDAIEAERPPIEKTNDRRISVRADVRYDELLDYMNLSTDEAPTETMAQVMIDKLERMPKLGDRVEIEVGTLVVENMARRRITRLAIVLPETPKPEPA